MPEDPYAKYIAPSDTPTTAAAPVADTADPYAKYVVGSSSPEVSPTTPSDSSDPYAKYAAGSSESRQTEDAKPTSAPVNPNEGILSKAWNWSNTPLTESLFGLPTEREGAVGFERGFEHIASGFTSPLSLLLTAATFGTGGFIESAGANALKEAGLSAAEIVDVAKGSEAALQASKDLKSLSPEIVSALENGGHDLDLLQKAKAATGPLDNTGEFASKAFQGTEDQPGILEKRGFNETERDALAKAADTINKTTEGFSPVTDAVKAAGVDPAVWRRGQDLMYQNGLNERDLLGGSTLERAAFQIIKKAAPTMPVATAVKAAKTGQLLLNGGFTLQQLQTAGQMSPRFLDALKDGDYDKATEYGTEAVVGGVLGIFGASHALESAGELANPILDLNSRLKPSDQNLALNRMLGEKDEGVELGVAQARNLDKTFREALGHQDPNKNAPFQLKPEVKAKQDLELASVFHQIATGGDQAKAADWAEQLRADDGNFSKMPDTYKSIILNSLDRVAKGELSDREINASKLIKTQLDKNFEIGNAAGLLGDDSYVKDYMQRLYKDNNPETNGIVDASRRGNFSTNVTMAQRRVFDSHIQALLKSPQEITLDPVGLTAEGRRATLEAAANKKLVADFLNRGNKMSDGRPVAVLSGTGRPVVGSDGENPATLVNPTQVRDIRIADNEIQNLTKTGDLQRFLDDGTIREISPKVHSGNISTAISKLDQEAITARGGTGENQAFDSEGNLVRLKNLQLLKDVQAGKRPYSDLEEYNNSLKPSYVYDPQDYISVNNGALRGWNFVSNDTAGNSILVRSDIRFHPEIAEYLKNRLGLEKSSLQANPISKGLLNLGGGIKKNILSLSPFHLAQEALRAVMVGVNPLHIDGPDIETGAKVDPSDPNSPTKIAEMVKQGFTPGVDYQGLQDHSEGLSGGAGLLRKIPGVGKPIANSLDWYQRYLFSRYIPNLKSRAAELMFDRYQTAHPDWSIDRVAKAAAIHTNDTFGGQNFKALGRSATTQDWGRLLLLAPDWLEGEMRSGARLFNKEDGGLGRAQMLKMTMAMWGTARVLNMLTTGNPHYEAPFGLAVKNKEGKETIFSMRTLPGDTLHAASDPVGFIKGRLSPTAHLATEVVTGRDNFGRKLTPGDMAVDIFRNMMPLPTQAIGQAMTNTGPDVGSIGQIVKAVGGTAQSYATPAQKLAAELAASHNEDGYVDPAMMARHKAIMDLENKTRAGELQLPDIYRLYASGQIHKDDLTKITTNLNKTKDMDASMASLYSRASRLPAPEYLQVYDQLSPHEKEALLPLTMQVRKKYISKMMKNAQPSERLQDPTFTRLMGMVPDQSPF